MPSATTECPLCHSRASFASRVPYCAQCGWNRDKAVAVLRTNMKMLPISIIMFGVFISIAFFTTHRSNPFPVLLFLGIPVCIFVVTIFATMRTLNKLQALPAPPAASTVQSSDSSSTGPSAAAFEPSLRDQALLRTSRPREIRMAARGKFMVVLSFLVVLAFVTMIGVHLYAVWARTLSFATFEPKDWAITGGAALLLLIPCGLWRSQGKECDLLENGEVVLGKVTRQWSSGRNNSSVEYTFKDFEGHEHKAVGYDYTMKLFEGMTVPVFYDRDNPKRQIASCSTFHEVVA
jgi:hypothetical protein